MRSPFAAIADLGLGGFCAMQLMLGGGVAAALLHGPMVLLMLAALLSPANLLGPAGFALTLFGYCVGVFSALTACALSNDLSHAAPHPLCRSIGRLPQSPRCSQSPNSSSRHIAGPKPRTA